MRNTLNRIQVKIKQEKGNTEIYLSITMNQNKLTCKIQARRMGMQISSGHLVFQLSQKNEKQYSLLLTVNNDMRHDQQMVLSQYLHMIQIVHYLNIKLSCLISERQKLKKVENFFYRLYQTLLHLLVLKRPFSHCK